MKLHFHIRKQSTRIVKVACWFILGGISTTVEAHLSSFDGSIREYRNGDFIPAFKGLKILAESGDVVSQYYVGLMYETGQGTAKDEAQALQWYAKAAKQNYAKAQNNLGSMYFTGRGTARDDEQAKLWFGKAAKKGLTAAQWNLGNAYYTRSPTDNDKAIYWFEKAAAKGGDVDEYLLAIAYYHLQKKDARSAYWMRRAAVRGIADAQRFMGEYYSRGVGVPRNYGKAMYWYKKASLQGHDEASYQIALMYRLGMGVPKNIRLEEQWSCRAAKQGNANAIFDIVRGAGAECVREAAEQGIVIAQQQIGQRYENPIGTTHDYVNAAFWYRRAAEKGDESAMYNLGDLYARGLGLSQDVVIAKMLYILGGEGKYGRDHTSLIPHSLSETQIKEAQDLAGAWKVGIPLPDKSETGRLHQ